MSEFIAFCAAFTAIAAMSIDIMLPALPAIGKSFGVLDPNRAQLVVVGFSIGFAVAQLFFGPLSDRFGRKPILSLGLGLYIAGTVGSLVVSEFTLFLAMRLLQGVGAAALRVVIMAVVRDCFAGPGMARVLTFVFTTFMLVPIIAPSLGQAIEFVAGWHGIFLVLGLTSALMALWMGLRFKETLAEGDRRPLSLSHLASAFIEICTNRIAAGYTLASMLTTIGLFSYIVSVQQVYGELYGLGTWFPVAFGASALGIAVTALYSARLSRKTGMRTVTHIALSVFAIAGLLLSLTALFVQPPFMMTFACLSLCMMAFGVLQGNIGAIAMEPLGHLAGIASSLFGVVTTTVGVVAGGLVGQSYNGTVLPLALAFGLSGLGAVLIVLWTEKGRLFVH
jgi:DHA1 family bicyclomycin/chloramphenicol resistance-like MFS transporter